MYNEESMEKWCVLVTFHLSRRGLIEIVSTGCKRTRSTAHHTTSRPLPSFLFSLRPRRSATTLNRETSSTLAPSLVSLTRHSEDSSTTMHQRLEQFRSPSNLLASSLEGTLAFGLTVRSTYLASFSWSAADVECLSYLFSPHDRSSRRSSRFRTYIAQFSSL